MAAEPERTFHYRIPADLADPAPGSLLLLPYGSRLALGYRLPDDGGHEPPAPADHELRDVEGVVSSPVLTAELLALAERLARYYRAPLGITLSAMLPAGLEARLTRRWRVTDLERVPAALAAVAGDEGLVDEADLGRALEGDARRWIERLRRQGAIRSEWQLREPEGRRRPIRTLRAVDHGGVDGRGVRELRSPRQRALLERLSEAPRSFQEIAAEMGESPGVLLEPARALARRGLAELGWHDADRHPLAHRAVPGATRSALAPEQLAAADAIAGLPAGGELLMEGVAASGKTDVYLAAVEEQLARGLGCILLVPEIALVPQVADRVRAAFGDRLAVIHSGLSPGERYDEWWRVLRGEATVVVGTRMAVFAPLAAPGLIVIDEEHDGAYKQDRTPRYDARWIARARAELSGARVVLASATPDVVTLHRARDGAARAVRLRERRAGSAPSLDVVDLRGELVAGNRSIFSRALHDALAHLAVPDEQAILLINRRGAATFVLCRDCGASVRCPECDLPYVFHLAGGVLRCHHCGRTAPAPSVCPSCGGPRIRYFGAGTQRVEAELGRLFPALRTVRLDSDVLATRRGYETVYDGFREGRYDVLVGTQMVAKGLDLPRVTLVAVVAADVTLNLPDYRAAERTFQLVAQVAGRAGRGPRPGRVIVQTYAPDHYAIRTAAASDVEGFADEELPRRRLLGYPPFSHLARLVLTDADRNRAEDRGARLVDDLVGPDVEAFGPAPAYVPRRAGLWRVQVVLRASNVEARTAALRRVPPGVAIDVDPESLL